MQQNRRAMIFRRFSLRAFLIAFTLLAVCFAVWADRSRRQRTAVAGLRELGARIYYDFELTRGISGEYEIKPGPDGYLGQPAVSDVPAWLVKSLGIDYFHTSAVVYLYIPRPLDALPLLKRLPNLKEVHYPRRGETDDEADLEQLRNELPNVKVIADLAIVG